VGRMTAENRAFVARSGKWTAVDVSQDPDYTILVGAVLAGLQLIEATTGKVIGLVIHTSGGDLRAEVEADDLYVQVC
jgi:hypothetical protein